MNRFRWWRESKPGSLSRRAFVWNCFVLAPFNLAVAFFHSLSWLTAVNVTCAVLIFGLGIWQLSQGPKNAELDRKVNNARQHLRKLLP